MKLKATHKISGLAEEELWVHLRQDDERAFEALMLMHYKPLFRYGTRLNPDEELIRDCIQEVFTSVWERRRSLPVIQSGRFYLLKALRKRLLYELRKTQRESPLDWTPDYHFWAEYAIDTSLIAGEEAHQQSQKLEMLLNALPPRQKEVIHLRFFQNLSHEEIAEMMQMNRQSVYNLLHETLRKLRKHWNPMLLLILLKAFW
jgi:RNA polymerase sigma factor (sigma-70 family)